MVRPSWNVCKTEAGIWVSPSKGIVAAWEGKNAKTKPGQQEDSQCVIPRKSDPSTFSCLVSFHLWFSFCGLLLQLLLQMACCPCFIPFSVMIARLKTGAGSSLLRSPGCWACRRNYTAAFTGSTVASWPQLWLKTAWQSFGIFPGGLPLLVHRVLQNSTSSLPSDFWHQHITNMPVEKK